MRVVVTFSADVPEHATEAQIAEWIEFNLGYRGDIKTSNPLADHDIYADSVDNISIV